VQGIRRAPEMKATVTWVFAIQSGFSNRGFAAKWMKVSLHPLTFLNFERQISDDFFGFSRGVRL
jgi:hypothetical protein